MDDLYEFDEKYLSEEDEDNTDENLGSQLEKELNLSISLMREDCADHVEKVTSTSEDCSNGGKVEMEENNNSSLEKFMVSQIITHQDELIEDVEFPSINVSEELISINLSSGQKLSLGSVFSGSSVQSKSNSCSSNNLSNLHGLSRMPSDELEAEVLKVLHLIKQNTKSTTENSEESKDRECDTSNQNVDGSCNMSDNVFESFSYMSSPLHCTKTGDQWWCNGTAFFDAMDSDVQKVIAAIQNWESPSVSDNMMSTLDVDNLDINLIASPASLFKAAKCGTLSKQKSSCRPQISTPKSITNLDKHCNSNIVSQDLPLDYLFMGANNMNKICINTDKSNPVCKNINFNRVSPLKENMSNLLPSPINVNQAANSTFNKGPSPVNCNSGANCTFDKIQSPINNHTAANTTMVINGHKNSEKENLTIDVNQCNTNHLIEINHSKTRGHPLNETINIVAKCDQKSIEPKERCVTNLVITNSKLDSTFEFHKNDKDGAANPDLNKTVTVKSTFTDKDKQSNGDKSPIESNGEKQCNAQLNETFELGNNMFVIEGRVETLLDLPADHLKTVLNVAPKWKAKTKRKSMQDISNNKMQEKSGLLRRLSMIETNSSAKNGETQEKLKESTEPLLEENINKKYVSNSQLDKENTTLRDISTLQKDAIYSMSAGNTVAKDPKADLDAPQKLQLNIIQTKEKSTEQWSEEAVSVFRQNIRTQKQCKTATKMPLVPLKALPIITKANSTPKQNNEKGNQKQVLPSFGSLSSIGSEGSNAATGLNGAVNCDSPVLERNCIGDICMTSTPAFQSNLTPPVPSLEPPNATPIIAPHLHHKRFRLTHTNSSSFNSQDLSMEAKIGEAVMSLKSENASSNVFISTSKEPKVNVVAKMNDGEEGVGKYIFAGNMDVCGINDETNVTKNVKTTDLTNRNNDSYALKYNETVVNDDGNAVNINVKNYIIIENSDDKNVTANAIIDANGLNKNVNDSHIDAKLCNDVITVNSDDVNVVGPEDVCLVNDDTNVNEDIDDAVLIYDENGKKNISMNEDIKNAAIIETPHNEDHGKRITNYNNSPVDNSIISKAQSAVVSKGSKSPVFQNLTSLTSKPQSSFAAKSIPISKPHSPILLKPTAPSKLQSPYPCLTKSIPISKRQSPHLVKLSVISKPRSHNTKPSILMSQSPPSQDPNPQTRKSMLANKGAGLKVKLKEPVQSLILKRPTPVLQTANSTVTNTFARSANHPKQALKPLNTNNAPRVKVPPKEAVDLSSNSKCENLVHAKPRLPRQQFGTKQRQSLIARSAVVKSNGISDHIKDEQNGTQKYINSRVRGSLLPKLGSNQLVTNNIRKSCLPKLTK